MQVSVDSACVFGQGKDIVRADRILYGPCRHVEIDDSGFGPHAAAIQVLGAQDEAMDLPSPPATVKLTRSSFILDPRCIAVSTASAAAITAGHCLFAPASSEPMPPPTVIQTARRDGTTFIAGQRNAYYQVNPFAIGSGDSMRSYTFDECRSGDLPFTDMGAVMLTQRPWAESRPLDMLANGVTNGEIWGAFRLRVESDPALFLPQGNGSRLAVIACRVPRSPARHAPCLCRFARLATALHEGNRTAPVGLVSRGERRPTASRHLYRSGYAPARGPQRRHHPDSPYRTLASGGNLRDQGPNRRARVQVDVQTIPRLETYLTPRADWTKLDQSLFRLLSGEVEFDGLQFLLKPSRPRNRQEVAALTVIGGKGCTFKNCVFTLQEEDESKAAAVLIADPDKFMVMDTKERPGARVKFEKCVIRGKGARHPGCPPVAP